MPPSRDFRQYYLDERAFFRDMVQDFARDNEEAGGLRSAAYDPDVERLIDGMAFLNAHTLQTLDAEFPELLYPLLQHMWPHVLRPTPAVAVIQFDIKNAEGMQFGAVVPRHTQVHSRDIPVGPQGETCRFAFRTCHDLQILPLELQLTELNNSRSQLRLQFKVLRRASLLRLLPPQPGVLPKLRLSLHGEMAQRYSLYWALRHYKRITLRVPQAGIELSSERSEAVRLRPLGFAGNEALLPYSPNGLFPIPMPEAGGRGQPQALPYVHRHLNEFMFFPEKHLFFDLEGLEVLERRLRELPAQSAVADTLEILIDLNPEDPRSPSRLASGDIRMLCVPAVNLFEHRAEHCVVDHTRLEYPLSPAGTAEHFDIFAVQRVTATHSRGKFRDKALHSFDSFKRGSAKTSNLPMYQVRLRAPVLDRTDDYPAARTYLAMASPNGELPPLDADDSLLLEADLLCTNRDLPTKFIHPGDITGISIAVPEGVKLRNLGTPSEAVPAPVGADGLWRFLGTMSQGWGLLASTDSLRELIALHDSVGQFSGRARRRSEQLCNGIERIAELSTKSRLLGQPAALVMGTHLTLQLRDSAFDHLGQFLLFGEVLGHYLAEMSAINTYVQLTLQTKTLSKLRFPPMVGGHGLLAFAPSLEESL